MKGIMDIHPHITEAEGLTAIRECKADRTFRHCVSVTRAAVPVPDIQVLHATASVDRIRSG
jgi:hypothetical protein